MPKAEFRGDILNSCSFPAHFNLISDHPELLEDWPVDTDLVVPVENLPENLRKNMGAHWEYSIKNRKILEER